MDDIDEQYFTTHKDELKGYLLEVWNVKNPTDEDIWYFIDNAHSYNKQAKRFNRYRFYDTKQ